MLKSALGKRPGEKPLPLLLEYRVGGDAHDRDPPGDLLALLSISHLLAPHLAVSSTSCGPQQLPMPTLVSQHVHVLDCSPAPHALVVTPGQRLDVLVQPLAKRHHRSNRESHAASLQLPVLGQPTATTLGLRDECRKLVSAFFESMKNCVASFLGAAACETTLAVRTAATRFSAATALRVECLHRAQTTSATGLS